MNFKKIDQIDFIDKKALIRVDYNVPINSNLEVIDESRILSSLPTINKILKVDYGFTTEVGPAKLTKEGTFYKLKRWDTNDFWDSKWKRPDSSCIKNI